MQFGWLLVLSLWICCAAAFEPSFLAAKSIEGSFSERTAYPTKRVVNDDDVIAVATFRNQLTTPKMMVEAAKKKLGTKDNTAEDRKSTRLNSSHVSQSRMPSSA